MTNDYCFAVCWSNDDERAEGHVVKANSRDEAWAKLCVELSKDTLDPFYEGQSVSSASLQFIKEGSDNRHRSCHYCGERLGPNPFMSIDRYWHQDCWLTYTDGDAHETA